LITNLSPQAQRFLADMERVQEAVNQASQQVSSTKRVTVASDSPDVVSGLLQLRAAMQRNSQITTNLGIAQADADISESALSAAVQLMDRAVTLAAQAATETADATSRQSIATEIESLLEQMINASQTESAGRYVFSGDQDKSPSYQLDLANGNGVDQLTTAPSTRLIEHPAGGGFAAAQTAQQIFDDRNVDGTYAADNVFAALNGLRNALLLPDADDPQDAIKTQIDALHQASDHLNICLAFYGTVQNRIQDATNFASQYDTRIKTQISQMEDADVVAASLELSQGTAQLQAAYQMEAQVPQTTLFDFINH
jgi:flagellar hook-associated protein 3 FlgL